MTTGYITLKRAKIQEFSDICKETGLREQTMLQEAAFMYLPTLRRMAEAKTGKKYKSREQ